MEMSSLKKRIKYAVIFLVLLLTEIAIGTWGRGFIRGFVGDVLVIPTIYFLLRIIFVRDRIFTAYVLPILVYFLGIHAEVLQAWGLVERLGIPRDSVLAIAIGGVCDMKDILAYLLGLYLIGLMLIADRRDVKGEKGWYPLAVFVHWTWGYAATMLGFIVYLVNFGCPHSYYRGVVRTVWNSDFGLSLGMFIFTPRGPAAGDDTPEALSRRDYCNEITVHEYGHTFQALLLGPLYLIVIGIPSLAWGILPCFNEFRKRKNKDYTWLFCESWASRWGEKVTGEKAYK